ncbi:hypothetical protein [Algoriphagus sp. Y33]|nr:hypothetical protein [Algoriphagus sp. Y33]
MAGIKKGNGVEVSFFVGDNSGYGFLSNLLRLDRQAALSVRNAGINQ